MERETTTLPLYNITDYFDYEKYGNDFDVTLYDSGYIDTTAMSEVDLHRYSLEEIKDELDYNNEEIEDKKLKIVSGESDLFREGMYRPALIPQIAIYPDAAFES